MMQSSGKTAGTGLHELQLLVLIHRHILVTHALCGPKRKSITCGLESTQSQSATSFNIDLVQCQQHDE